MLAFRTLLTVVLMTTSGLSSLAALPGRIFFVRNHDLWVAQDNKEKRLFSDGILEVSSSASENRLVLTKCVAGLNKPPIERVTDLWLFEMKTGALRRLTGGGGCRRWFQVLFPRSEERVWRRLPGNASHPLLSPDGRHVLYSWEPRIKGYDGGSGYGTVQLLTIATGERRTVNKFRFWWDGDPATACPSSWRPGRKEVLMALSGNVSLWGLLSFARRPHCQALPVPQKRQVVDPAWRPDGKVVAAALWPGIEQDQSKLFALALLTLSGRVVDVLATSKCGIHRPVWSPDGRSLAYVVNERRDGSPSQPLVNILDTASHKVIATIENAECPAWSE